MVLGLSLGAFTLLHVAITLIAIGSGLIVAGGMLASRRLPAMNALFLFTTVLTSLTGFLFPIHGFTPAIGVGIVSCVILAVALFAYYSKHLTGAWRWIYVVTAIASLYLNAFVLVVQSFVSGGAQRAGADASRTAIRDDAGRGAGDLHPDRARRRPQFPPGAGHRIQIRTLTAPLETA
jgi:hypothetical protein